MEYTMHIVPDPLNYPIGTGNILVTRLDGTTKFFEAIIYDGNRMENGFLVMETDDSIVSESVYHVANVDYWEVIY